MSVASSTFSLLDRFPNLQPAEVNSAALAAVAATAATANTARAAAITALAARVSILEAA